MRQIGLGPKGVKHLNILGVIYSMFAQIRKNITQKYYNNFFL
jgi:predicted transcriptional regulator